MNRFGPVSVPIKQLDTISVGHKRQEPAVLFIGCLVMVTQPRFEKISHSIRIQHKGTYEGMHSFRLESDINNGQQ